MLSAGSSLARLPVAMGWLYLSFFCLALHFINPVFTNPDAWFHARLSAQFPEMLLARTFPATAYSIWNDTWADKEVLFHLWLMPFTQVPAWEIAGTKLGCALLNIGFAASLFLAMRGMGIRGAAAWALAILLLPPHWWARMSMVRGHLGSLVLVPLVLWFFMERRPRALLVTCFLFSWAYTAPYYALVLCVGLAAGRWLIGRVGADDEGASRGDGRLLLAALVGTLLGIVIHPNIGNNIVSGFTTSRVVLASAWGLDGGQLSNVAREFDSWEMRRSLVDHVAMYAMLGAAWMGAALAGGGVLSTRSRLLLWMTMPLLAQMAITSRFIEYIAPVSLWALASVVSDWLAAGKAPRLPGPRPAWLVLACVVALALHAHTVARVLPPKLAPQPTLEGAGAWLRENAEPGSLVIPIDWSMFPALYFHAPGLRYPVGLDPTLMDAANPREARVLEGLFQRRIPLRLETIHEAFPEATHAAFWARNAGGASAIQTLDALGYQPVFRDDRRPMGGVVYPLPPVYRDGFSFRPPTPAEVVPPR